jgi:response regulator NasT
MIRAAVATSTFKIVTASADPELLGFLKEGLEDQLGHQILAESPTGTDLVRNALATEPDVVVADLHLPRSNGLESLRQIYQERPVAAVLLTPERDQDLVRPLLEECYLSYLVKPVEIHQLEPAIWVAWARFSLFRQLSSENAVLRQTLESRKLIERAKGVLMRRYRWSEADAYRRLQRCAMNRRTTMANLAQSVLNGCEIEV